jgi:YYY domain-containing protein
MTKDHKLRTALNGAAASVSLRNGSLRTWLKRLAAAFNRPRIMNTAVLIVFLAAAWIRFQDFNWDSGTHLHPDERFLSTTTNDLKWPQDLKDYFDPGTSTLSPYSLPDMGLFVYGTLPVYIVKWTSILLNKNNYDMITLVGRAMSGIFDLGALVLLFLIGRRLYGKGVGLLAALLLSFSVLNIQLSHFYTVDTYANLFVVATIYFLLRAAASGRWGDYALAGLMFGLGLASKVSVFTLAVPIMVTVGLDYYRRSRSTDVRSAFEPVLVRFLTVLLFAALVFRLAQPIAFSGPGFWNWSLNPRWVRDMLDQQNTVTGNADLPWVQQWTNRSIFFALYNIVVWGLGLPLGLAGLAGFGLAAFELVRLQKIEHLLPLVYVAATFIYHGLTFIKFMRYFLPIYPFLALFAAYLIFWIWRKAGVARSAVVPQMESGSSFPRWQRALARIRFTQPLALGVSVFVVGGTLCYALAFSSIYSRPNSRVTASRWIYQNIPAGSTLANEAWDDWLPIGGLDGKDSYGDHGLFKSVEMPNYDDDTPDKLNKLVDNLTAADYVILSSNRLYDSIPRLPMRYPMTIRYYQLLFSGKLGFERVAEFTSYPTLFGIQIPDQVAEESFSVYDHPRVQIFKKTAAFSTEQVRQSLAQGLKAPVVHLTPLEATVAPNGLMLTSGEQADYQQTAVWSSAEVNPDSWGSHLPVPAWFIVLELMGFIVLPITLVVFRRFVDRGYIWAKALGLLLVSWGGWIVASLRLAPFTWWALLIFVILLAVASVAIYRQQRVEFRRFVQTRWRLILLEEGLFWAFFLVMLLIRMLNPDLWHPYLGGEKPMDLAYLTAIARTPYFPAYDPWFAGGYINYYYFGFVFVATLIHLTGIVPYIAYNLAVPTFFAMTALGSFSIVLNLASIWRDRQGASSGRHCLGLGRSVLLAAVCGALFVVVIGNLGQVKLLWDGVRGLSSITANNGGPSPLLTITQFTDGLGQLLAGHKLPINTEWWYWNATRLIPKAPDESGPINEMPAFTFLFADLHAHMMALPYTLLALALSLVVVQGTSRLSLIRDHRSWWRDGGEVLLLLLLALTTGALWPANTWDYPTYMLVAALALGLREVARRGQVSWAGIWAAVWRTILVALVGWLFFLPFHQNYASVYFGAELWTGSRTPLWAYLLIHGLFLFVLVSYLMVEFLYGHGHNALVRSLRLHFKHWRHLRRMRRLFDRLTLPTPGYRLAVNLSWLFFVLLLLVLLVDPVVGLALLLSSLTGLLLVSARPSPRRQFILFMVFIGFMLTALVEVVVLKGDVSRMNTVFKFYLQVWVLWAVASAAVLPHLAARFKAQPRAAVAPAIDLPEGSPWTPEIAAQFAHAPRLPRPGGVWGRRWWWAFGILLACCLLYPLTAVPMRIKDRFENSHSITLDGTEYMSTSVYSDDDRPVDLSPDRQALFWLRQNVQGIPVILEANTPIYRWGSRVSIYTGLPTVIGWDWHQKQQRSVLPGELIDQRIEDVKTMYDSTDVDQVTQLLDLYQVRYIYVGGLERLYYDAAGLAKFDLPHNSWHLVYHNDQVKIYQVH